jgi:hypothetical protein
MSEAITKAMKRPGVVPAFLTALGVFVALLAISFVQGLFSTLTLLSTASIAQDYAGQIWFGLLVNSVTGPLPFAIGVFLCLWQVAPIVPALRLAHVVTRSVLAALLGAAVMWIVLWVAQVIADAAGFAREFQGAIVFGKLGPDALQALFRALSVTAGYLPVAVLAGILLWGWLQRHPLDKAVHGALDEV